MESKSSLVQMNCMLRVDTQSPGWEKSLTKVIKRIKDVSYSIDVARGIVSISGEINPNKLLTEIKKAGRHAELIHAYCGVAHSHPNYGHVYDYDGRYGQVEPHNPMAPCSSYCVPSQPGHGCIQLQYDPHHQFNGLPSPTITPQHVHASPHLCPTPTAPPMEYDPYNSSCIIS